MKRIIKDYLTFSRKERIAVLVLLVLMSAFIAAPYLYEPEKEMPVLTNEFAAFLNASAAEATDSTNTTHRLPVAGAGRKPVELFAFDPNTINEAEWLRLGVSTKVTRTLLNYLSKGGKFRSPEDLRKIWGLSKTDADRLIPYVQIPGKQQPFERKQEPPKTLLPKTIRQLDINTAAVDEWRSLPGIGEVLSERIVKFRDRSGGFLSVEHVKKTYGISDSLFAAISPYLRFSTATMPRLNLNTATVYDLRSKTGMPYQMAKAIVDFRMQNGVYAGLDDVRKAVQIPDSLFQKMALLIKTE